MYNCYLFTTEFNKHQKDICVYSTPKLCIRFSVIYQHNPCIAIESQRPIYVLLVCLKYYLERMITSDNIYAY